MDTTAKCANEQVKQRIFDLLKKKKNYTTEIIAAISEYQYVVFYGCGSMFNSVIDRWNSCIGKKIDYCCDSDDRKWGKTFRGIKCISPHELNKIKENCAVFVTIDCFIPVIDLLKRNGFSFVSTLYKFDLVEADFLANNSQLEIGNNLFKTYELLSDQRSVNVFNSIIERVLGDSDDPEVMARVCEKDQYFAPDIINLTEREAFVDVGAFNGDTVLQLLERTANRFDQIFAFEMNRQNFYQLTRNITGLTGYDRIKTFNFGAWDKEMDVTYSLDDSSSRIGEGTEMAHVVALDEILDGERITFIKMDIEGAEPHALRGAARIIREQQPALAICIYHEFRHLWEIPLYLRQLVPSYKIYLRQYTNIERETVCYAVV